MINQSVVGVVLEARRFPQIAHVYGARHGVRGVLNEDFINLGETTTQNLEAVAVTPAAGLGLTRDKPDVEYCAKMFKVLQAHDIRCFFYCGGNDSFDTCRIVNEQARLTNYDLCCVHVPKTIDNDLVGTDHCPGFGSAWSARRLPDCRGCARSPVRGRRSPPHLHARARVRRGQVRG